MIKGTRLLNFTGRLRYCSSCWCIRDLEIRVNLLTLAVSRTSAGLVSHESQLHKMTILLLSECFKTVKWQKWSCSKTYQRLEMWGCQQIPSAYASMQQALQEEWHAIPQATIQNLFNSMRWIWTTCINARGGHISYWFCCYWLNMPMNLKLLDTMNVSLLLLIKLSLTLFIFSFIKC